MVQQPAHITIPIKPPRNIPPRLSAYFCTHGVYQNSILRLPLPSSARDTNPGRWGAERRPGQPCRGAEPKRTAAPRGPTTSPCPTGDRGNPIRPSVTHRFGVPQDSRWLCAPCAAAVQPKTFIQTWNNSRLPLKTSMSHCNNSNIWAI